ncbi:hypothetical protein PORCAN_1654 [Porphyromonas crevioricanis JCM 13913]|nr:hypothetical protein PORCAN_1654 [Porphyromonas crevioricanis JCM 13913]
MQIWVVIDLCQTFPKEEESTSRSQERNDIASPPLRKAIVPLSKMICFVKNQTVKKMGEIERKKLPRRSKTLPFHMLYNGPSE